MTTCHMWISLDGVTFYSFFLHAPVVGGRSVLGVKGTGNVSLSLSGFLKMACVLVLSTHAVLNSDLLTLHGTWSMSSGWVVPVLGYLSKWTCHHWRCVAI